MPKVVKPLTDTQVKNAKPKDKEYLLSDGGGLSCKVRPSGSKSWLFEYNHPISKKRQRIIYGSYPDLSLADVRKMREKHRSLIAKKIDPKAHLEKELREAQQTLDNTFNKTMQEWLEFKKPEVSPDYLEDCQNRLENHVTPHIGNRPISEITTVEVITALEPLKNEKKLDTLQKVCGLIKQVMTYAVNKGYIEFNQLSTINKAFNTPVSIPYATIKPELLGEFLQRLNISNGKLVTKLLVQYQLHTMLRPAEAATAKWEHIDFETRQWIIPANYMKRTSKSKYRELSETGETTPHIVPLTNQTIEILIFMQSISGGLEYVFPGDRNRNKHACTQSANNLIKNIGYKGKLVSHGLRSIASTYLNNQGFDSDLVEKSLSHIDTDKTRRAYNRAEYIERRRKVLQAWSDYIELSSNGMKLTVGF